MFSRFLSLGVVLSVVFCCIVLQASEELVQVVCWIGETVDGKTGTYLVEDFKTGKYEFVKGTINRIAVSDKICSHEINGYIFVSLNPENNSRALIVYSRVLGDVSGAEPELVPVDRDKVIRSIPADKNHYFEPADHKKYELDKRLFASH